MSHPALLRLMHLVSPSLPIGSFTYSQGIEWAVEADWINSADSLLAWMQNQLDNSVKSLDLPVLKQMYHSIRERDKERLVYWIEYLNASRETHELLLEEKNRGRALTDLLIKLALPIALDWKFELIQSQSAAFALAAVEWKIPLDEAAYGYVWSWLENLVLSAVKIIPLGQTEGQSILHEMIPMIEAVVASGLCIEEKDIGASLPALAIASSLHESQYTRLFRS